MDFCRSYFLLDRFRSRDNEIKLVNGNKSICMKDMNNPIQNHKI